MPLAVHTAHYGDPVRAFVETVVFEAGFEYLEPLPKAELVTALLVEAHKRIGLDLMKSLDKGSLDYFRSLQKKEASDDEMASFFRVRVPDLDARLKKTLSEFGAECLRMSRELGQKSARL